MACWIVHWHKIGKRVNANPEEPWLWREDWVAKVIRPSTMAAYLIVAWFFTFFLLALVPFAVALASIKLPGLIYGFFGLFRLFLLAFAKMLWTNARWNRSEFRIARLPGLVGGSLSGAIVLAETFPQGTPFRITLGCKEMIPTRGQEFAHAREHLWQEQIVIDRSDAPLGVVEVPFGTTTPSRITPCTDGNTIYPLRGRPCPF